MSDKLSDQIRKAIRESGISQYRLATEVRMNTGHLSRFMSGKAGLSLDALDRIGLVLGLRIVATRRRDG
jgi:transcriptional regulator with XRE-family HTH domain